MNDIIKTSIRDFCNNRIKCRLFVPSYNSLYQTIYTGYIIEFDDEYLLFEDKYKKTITIKQESINRIEKFVDNNIKNNEKTSEKNGGENDDSSKSDINWN
jgi:hypothetical protein